MKKQQLDERLKKAFKKVLSEKKVRIKLGDDPSYGIDETLDEQPSTSQQSGQALQPPKPGESAMDVYNRMVKVFGDMGKLKGKMGAKQNLGSLPQASFEARNNMDDLSNAIDDNLDITGMGQEDVSQLEGEDLEACPKCDEEECDCDETEEGFDPVSNDDPESFDLESGCGLSLRDAMYEAAPPSDKAESFIKKNKEAFKKRYGSQWKSVLYSTAAKMFPEKD